MDPKKTFTDKETGSSDTDEPVFLVVGQFGRPHGVRGELQFRPFTDFPERLVAGKVILVGDELTPRVITGVRGSPDRMILAIEGFSDRDQAAFLRNELVYVRSTDLPVLEEGQFYHHELLGLRVLTEAGETLGELIEIIDTPANEVFVVRKADGKDILLPAIDDVILEIDPDKRLITVRMLDGL